VGYGRHCMCRGLHFLWKNELYIKDRNYILRKGFLNSSEYKISEGK
jgi:hypothetical protein